MSKRSYPSESENRKKAVHQKEVIEKLPKLTSYFTTGETSTNSMLKTPVTVLQEMGVKLGMLPEYEHLGQSGPAHLAIFEYRCTMCGESATATAGSKKEAKQEAARALLSKLARTGLSVPPAYVVAPPPSSDAPQMGHEPDTRTYVALVHELCEEYKLAHPVYTLVGDSGPPHMRRFTIRCTVGENMRQVTAGTKKLARQLASEQLYKYLRQSLRFTQDFVEDDALVRAHEKKMARFEETRDLPWRPDLTQKVSQYDLALVQQIDEKLREQALEAFRETAEAKQSARVQLDCAASTLGLEVTWSEMETVTGEPKILVELSPSHPALITCGTSEEDAAADMVKLLRILLVTPAAVPMD